MAIPTYRNSTNGSNAGGASPTTCNVPSGTVNGDVMIAIAMCGGVVTITPPAGWTQLDVNFAQGPSSGSWYRIASSEPASYSWTYAGTPNCIVGIYTAQNVDNSLPVDQHSAWHRRTGATTITGDSITPTRNNELLVFGGTASQAPATQPSGWTSRQNVAAGGVSLLIGELAQGTAAATGAVNGTIATANTQGTLISLPGVAVKGFPLGVFF